MFNGYLEKRRNLFKAVTASLLVKIYILLREMRLSGLRIYIYLEILVTLYSLGLIEEFNDLIIFQSINYLNPISNAINFYLEYRWML